MMTKPLPADAFHRIDEAPDSLFYRLPRFVQHIDEDAVATVTQIYREFLPADVAVLDLMSSWVSHLPPEQTYPRVVGLGLNREELSANTRLDDFVVHDLNEQPILPFDDGQFGAVVNCVSLDYLIRPVEVLRDLGRVVRPGGPLIITFSNRCFPTKAIKAWLEASEHGRCKLIEHFLHEAGNWDHCLVQDRSPHRLGGDPLYLILAESHGPPVNVGEEADAGS